MTKAPKITQPTVFDRGGHWYAQWRVDGRRSKVATGIAVAGPMSERQALTKAIELQARNIAKYAAKNQVDVKMLPAAEVFVIDRGRKEREGLATSTLEQQRRYAERFVEHFGPDQTLVTLSAFEVENWRDWLLKQERDYSRVGLKVEHPELKARGKKYVPKATRKTLSGKTVKEHLSWLSSVCSRYDVAPNPCKRVKQPRKTDVQKQEELLYYTKDELTALILGSEGVSNEDGTPDFANHRDDWMFHFWLVFVASTGVRIGEAQGVRPKDIDFDRSLAWVVSDKTKKRRGLNIKNLGWVDDFGNGERRDYTPLHALRRLMDFAKEHYGEDFSDQSPLYFRHSKWFYNRLAKQCEASEIPFKAVHALRHSWCTEAIRKGWPPTRIAQFMGHATLATFYSIYGHLTIEETPELRYADEIEG